jgi:hypothetical protein
MSDLDPLGLARAMIAARTCPDCSACADPDDELVHDMTCPLGLALDVVCADDRDWFEARPAAPYRVRPMALVEVEDLRTGGITPGRAPTGWRVVVRPLAPRVRVRRFLPPGCECPRCSPWRAHRGEDS